MSKITKTSLENIDLDDIDFGIPPYNHDGKPRVENSAFALDRNNNQPIQNSPIFPSNQPKIPSKKQKTVVKGNNNNLPGSKTQNVNFVQNVGNPQPDNKENQFPEDSQNSRTYFEELEQGKLTLDQIKEITRNRQTYIYTDFILKKMRESYQRIEKLVQGQAKNFLNEFGNQNQELLKSKGKFYI